MSIEEMHVKDNTIDGKKIDNFQRPNDYVERYTYRQRGKLKRF
jgi:hypothetical protein